MSNIKRNIDGHNKSVLSKKNVATRNCNCRKPADCPMNGDCLKQSVVYQATVSTNDCRPDQTYVGLTGNSFKTRFANHKASFSNPTKKHSKQKSFYKLLSYYFKPKNRCNFISLHSYRVSLYISVVYCGNFAVGYFI